MDKINEQMYQANIDLVDKNKLLEEDKKILMKRINRALEYIKEAYELDEINVGNIYHEAYGDIEKILKGRYVENGN